MSQKTRKIGKVRKEEEKKYFGLDRKQRSRIYTILFFVVVIILFIVNNSADDTKQGPYPPNYNKSQGKVLKLSDLREKVVLIDFWATWCAPCREATPDLVELKKEFKEKDFEIVGISVDALTKGGVTEVDVIPFMKAYKINYPIVRGDELAISAFGGIKSIPTSFLIDKKGKVVAKYEGIVSKKTYVENINKILTNDYDTTHVLQTPEFTLTLIEPK
ncbi:MAG: TlpA family protein disulfide reductase [Melioribacteraceae bacterium]|nr:TlpA family protein disulfide reductase [Melioribacteraceae bacterium]